MFLQNICFALCALHECQQISLLRSNEVERMNTGLIKSAYLFMSWLGVCRRDCELFCEIWQIHTRFTKKQITYAIYFNCLFFYFFIKLINLNFHFICMIGNEILNAFTGVLWLIPDWILSYHRLTH